MRAREFEAAVTGAPDALDVSAGVCESADGPAPIGCLRIRNRGEEHSRNRSAHTTVLLVTDWAGTALRRRGLR